MACKILVPRSGPEIEPCPLQWKHRALTTGLLGKSLQPAFYRLVSVHHKQLLPPASASLLTQGYWSLPHYQHTLSGPQLFCLPRSDCSALSFLKLPSRGCPSAPLCQLLLHLPAMSPCPHPFPCSLIGCDSQWDPTSGPFSFHSVYSPRVIPP